MCCVISVSARFGPTYTISACKQCHIHYLSGVTNMMQIPSNVPVLQIKPRTLVVHHLKHPALLLTSPQTTTNLPLFASDDMYERALRLVSPRSGP